MSKLHLIFFRICEVVSLIQTFLPYPDFEKTAKCLDWRRLGKQRVEARQIIENLEGNKDRWYTHPAVQMWKGYVSALKLYFNVISREWERRGYKHTMGYYDVNPENVEDPPWLGNETFHRTHRSNLLRKDPEYYAKYDWDVSKDLDYLWPKPSP